MSILPLDTQKPGPSQNSDGYVNDSSSGGLIGWLTRVTPNALVIVALCGLAYWGHRTEWNFVDSPGSAKGAAAEKAETESDPLQLIMERKERTKENAKLLPGARGTVRLQFSSTEAVDKAGVDIAPAWQMAMTEEITASGEVLFDPSLVARLSPRAAGTAWWVTKTAGDRVKVGEALAFIDATEVGKAKSEFLQNLVQVRLKRQAMANLAAAQGVVPGRQRREAEAAFKEAEVRLASAEQALTNLGLPIQAVDFEKVPLEEIVRRMRALGVAELPSIPGAKGMTANLVPIRAPMEGIVISADVVAGEVVDSSKVLFVVVDPRRMWIMLYVGPEQVPKVAVGQSVKFTPDGSKEEYEGRLTWVGTAADEVTRLVPVRAELANDAGNLRASTLGKGRIALRKTANAIVVPHEAIQYFRGVPVVFIRHADYLKPAGPKSFEPRVVAVGAKDSQNTEILSGLNAVDVVATKGSGLLLNELQRRLPR